MACNRPVYYPFLSDDAKKRIDDAVLACIAGRTARVETRQSERTERTESRQTEQTERVTVRGETAQELGYYATDLLYESAIPSIAGAVSSTVSAAFGAPTTPSSASAPTTATSAPSTSFPPVWVGLGALALLGVAYVAR